MSNQFRPKKQPTGDYEVGYAKPPKSGQWKPGQSGYPNGRRKQKLISDLGEAYHEAGQEIVSIPIRGKRRRMTLVQAAAFKAHIDAAAGDARARRDVMRAEELHARRSENGADKGWTIIHAAPVFDGEEDRGWNKLAEENAKLKRLVEQLQAQLAGVGKIPLLPAASGSAEDSA